ncbi:MAG: AAA family ATPase [Actinomycetota bacterium]
MRIGISGKGGVGKSTIAAVMARLLAQRGHRVLAIDCDSDPNLAMSAGVSEEAAARIRPLLDQSDGKRAVPTGLDNARLIEEYGYPGPDDVTLLLAARVERAGAG